MSEYMRNRRADSQLRTGERLKFARSLKGRLAIVVAVAIVVTGATVLLFSFFMARSIMREQVLESMEAVVSRTRGQIEITVSNLTAGAEALASSPRLRLELETATAGTDAVAVSARIGAILGEARIGESVGRGIMLVSGDGAHIASTGDVDGGSMATAENLALAAEVQPDRALTTFLLDDGSLIIAQVVPIGEPRSGRLLGVLLVKSNSPTLQSELEDSSGLGSSGRLLLSDFISGKVSVLSYDSAGADDARRSEETPRGSIARLPLNSDLPPVKAARGEKGEGEYTGLVDRKVVASFDYIPVPQWGITATADSSEAFAPIYRLRNVSVVVIVVLLFGGAALAYMIARTISRPLSQLQEGVKAFASGDLSTRVAIEDGIEVTALAQEFNNMARRLDDLYNNLEHKVEERTAELKEANERLKQLDHLKSDFVSMASHELRSPMASMKMGVSTVLREMVGPLNDDQKMMLDIAERNIDRLTKLTSELLDLTKMEAGQLDISLAESDVKAIAREVATADEPLARHKGLKLEVVGGEQPVEAMVDRDRVYQVIQNLVGNALKFTDEGGVTVMVEKADGRVKVSVRDTGAGIPRESLSTLFDKWSRAHSETISEKRGTGLGLAICKGIVEAHGGDITVESTTGKGTEFRFTLPVRGRDEPEKEDTDSR